MNVEVIKNLRVRLDELGKAKNTVMKETQTEIGLLLKCNECNFEGNNTRELSRHMSENHGWPEEQKSVDLD